MTAVIATPRPPTDDDVMVATDFSRSPFIVIWEVTRACALACVHCRADAIARRDPRELSTEEGYRLIDDIVRFGQPYPLFVLTGGDPMWRKDLVDLVRHATSAGLSVALTPSGTGAATKARLAQLRDVRLSRIAVSLDGPDPETHDRFRRVRGSYMYTMKIIDAAIELGLPLQINTTVSRITLPTLTAMADLVSEFPIALWAVFFLIQTGRGASLDQITARECEDVLCWLHALSRRVPFRIKTTEAPHFRRVIAEATRRPVPRAVTDGNGFVFIDHTGDICPSGFLPMARGNVRRASVVDVYRNDELFRGLRDVDSFEGRCGRCEFRNVCGGSRSRAYAMTGNAFASDPLCAYIPAVDEAGTPASAAEGRRRLGSEGGRSLAGTEILSSDGGR